jgi:hypothetical protein
MNGKVLGAAVFAASAAVVVVALRRFGPALAERGMKKCHEMMRRMSQEYPHERAVPGQDKGHEDSDLGHLGKGQKTPSMAVTT